MLKLPKIVEAAESGPNASAAAMYQIRKSLSKDNFNSAYKQYNAMMLFRILIDNPGTFKYITKNIENKFVEAVRIVLRMNKDPSVQQITRETLDYLAREKADNEDLAPLLKMWQKEKGSSTLAMERYNHGAVATRGIGQGQSLRPPHSDGRERHALPDPGELAGRIEEAKTSAKLLIQLVQSTPPTEFTGNELIREFADRCQAAQRSLHGYMNATDPTPDEATFQTLIETCEQLSLASSKHQRAALAARKQNRDVLDRAENLYNTASGSRDPSPNNAAAASPSPSSQSRPAPATTTQLERLAPLSRHASPRNESEETGMRNVEAANPFADTNRVSQSYAPSQALSKQQSGGVRRSPPTVQAPFIELPTTSTPPPTEPRHDAYAVNGGYAASPGQPPTRVAPPSAPQSQPGATDPYARLDALNGTHARRSPSAESNDLYSVDNHAHYVAANGTATKSSWAGAESPTRDAFAPGARGTMLTPRGKGKVKDDEPFSPVGGVSGSGWGY